ncbi:MAG: MATE family efflux transporter [Clostridia bacterium]|nr:MATE family efflux transporter [Clostridia bacterium]
MGTAKGLRKNEVNMLSGSIVKGLLAISIPIMIMNVSQNLFNIIDLKVLSDFVNDDAVGAVGTCATLISLITGLLIGISSGANVVISRHIGSGDSEGVEKAVGTAVLFSVVGGIAFAIIGIALAEVFLIYVMNCPEELLAQAVTYFRLYFLGVPILMLYNFCAAILRAMGDSRRPMIFMLIGGAVKVGSNIFFIVVLNLTVEGVALATILSWAIAGGLSLYVLCKNNGTVKLKFSRLRFYGKELKEILMVGIPAGLQTALYSVANVVITSAVNLEGKAATTGQSIATQYDAIIYQITYAPSLAIMPYVSQNIGNKNLERAKQSILKGCLIATVLGVIFGGSFALFSYYLAGFMTNDPLIIAYAQQRLILISATYFLNGIKCVLDAALIGMKKSIIPTISALVFQCLIRFPWVWFIYPLMKGNLTFLYLIWPIGWVLGIVTLLCFLFPVLKKVKKEIQNELSITEETAE